MFLFSLRLLAPAGRVQFVILKDEEITEQLPLLINAVTWVESRHDPCAFNPLEDAVGAFQIRPVRVEHYNKLKGTNYVLEDFYNYDLSLEMFLYFICHDSKGNEIPPKSSEQSARDWNGSGEATTEYWNLVKSFM